MLLLSLALVLGAGSLPLEPPPIVAAIAFEGSSVEQVKSLVEVQVGAPLDPRAVRDSVRALHASARFSRVSAWIEPLEPGKVRLIFVLAAIRKLTAVSFPGHQALAESILHQTANLQVNAEYQAESVGTAVEAVRAAYYRLGHRHARVQPETREVPGGVALELRIDEGPTMRVAELRFEGGLGLERDELRAAFRLGVGDVLSAAALDEGVRSVRERYRRAGRLRARVEPPHVEELSETEALVVVPVESGPQVRFHLRGNRVFSDSILAAQLRTDSEEPLDAQAASDLAARLRRFYVGAGFLRARVAEREMRARDGAVELVFSINEDRPVLVREVRFTGNQGLPTSQLRQRLQLVLRDSLVRDAGAGADPGEVEQTGLMGAIRSPHRGRYKVDPDTVFDPVLYARALKQMEDHYKSLGYLSARAGPPRLESIGDDGHELRVEISIKEGEQTLVSRISVEGGGDVPAAALDQAIVLHAGQPFSFLAAEEGRAALTQIFTRRGHLYAKVDDEEQFEETAEGAATAHVEVRYRIQPGPVVRVGYVEVIGQRRTLEGLVLDLVGLRHGDVLTPEVLDRGQQSLLRTGLFFSATLTPRNPEVAEQEKTVQVQLRERPTRDFQASLGFSLADGPRTTMQWTQGNLMGRNLTFTAVGKANLPFERFRGPPVCTPNPTRASDCTSSINFPSDPLERVVDFGISAPRLWPLTDALRAGIDLIHQRDLRLSYDRTKYSAQLSVEMTRRRPFNLGVAYEFGYQELSFRALTFDDYFAFTDRSLLRSPPGQMLFGSLRPTATLDFRDDPARPRSGTFFQASGDYLRSFTGSTVDVPQLGELQKIHVNLIKGQVLAALYIPLPFLSSIVLAGRGGYIWQLDSTSHTPGDRRFYLGGATSLRGFHEDALQPQDLVARAHAQVGACANTITGLGCTTEALLLQAGQTSDGGDEFLGANAELRVPVAQTVELALFLDAGNLWSVPIYALWKNLNFRYATGFGLRWLTPIGRMAIDIGINLSPDDLLGEPRFAPYFSIDPL